MAKKLNFLLVFSSVLLFSCSTEKEKVKVNDYPFTKKVDTVDTYFGTSVSDPYRWLENDLSEETAQWVKAQNEVTFGYLNHIPFREAIKKRLTSLIDYERLSSPVLHGDYYYYYKNDGLQNQSVFYRKKGEDGTPEVFIDPNKFKEDGTISLAGTFFSKDGALMAYMISEGGSDWRKAIVMDTRTKEIIGDTLKDVKFSGISWKGREGFYYSSYDKPKNASALSAKTQFHKIYYHQLGTPQSQDRLIFGGEKTPRRYVGAYLTEDERYLVITASQTTSGNELYIQDLAKKGSRMIPVINNFDNTHFVIENQGSSLIIQTNLDAPNNKIIKVNANAPTPENWKELIPETENVLNVSTAGEKIFASYIEDVKSKVLQYDLNGRLEREVALPGIGRAGGFNGRKEDHVLYYSFSSFTYPNTIFKYDIQTGKSSVYEKPSIDFDPEAYETRQVFYESKDGTKVPMFITFKKGMQLNGKNPVYLYGYGGFNASLLPSFSASRMVWLENGGIYAQANLRGGGEYGKQWHLAGTKMNKQNVFDDFIAAGEYLIKEGYTSSDYLAIAGGSNGGLLVGATMTQRPDLAKVALPAVGVMDMLRYHKFTAGAGWAYDYGTSEDSKEMFEYLYKYSPVHALEPGTSYPATLVTTADHDDRVVPAHSFKFAAQLQASHTGDNPVLIRIETDAGHGAGTPTAKFIEQAADMYAFAWYNMGVIPPLAKKEQ